MDPLVALNSTGGAHAPPSPKEPVDLLMLYFHEYPNVNAAIAATFLYLAITLVVLVLTVRTRSWFMIVAVVTGAFEAAGFGLRWLMIKHPDRNVYIGTQCFLIISPVLLAIVDYLAVGKLLALSEAGRKWWIGRWLSVLFTISDIFCLVLQGSGASLLVSEDLKMNEIGRNTLIAGLLLQLFFFTVFTLLTAYVQWQPKFGVSHVRALRPMFFCLYATIALMYVRNIFRSAEFIQGYSGTLASHEEYFYCFDFMLIYACFILLCFFHYGFYVGPGAPAAEEATRCAAQVPSPGKQMSLAMVAPVLAPVEGILDSAV